MVGLRQVALSFLIVVAGSGGSMALTASNAVPDTTAGYGTSTVTGATVTSIVYSVSRDGSQITGATLRVAGDITTGRTVQAGFGSADLVTCTIDHYNPGQDDTTASCTGMTQSMATATAFHVLVLNS